MFGIGVGEMLLLALIALLVLGPERMPKLARDLGKTVGDLRKTSDELRNEFLNADRSLNLEKALDVAARATPAPEPPASPPETGKAAEMGATMGESGTQADVVTEPEPAPVPSEAEETAFDRELREARERIERGEGASSS